MLNVMMEWDIWLAADTPHCYLALSSAHGVTPTAIPPRCTRPVMNHDSFNMVDTTTLLNDALGTSGSKHCAK